jgi:hypothetical protein
MKWLLASLTVFIGTIFFAVPAQAISSQLLITEIRLGGSDVMHGGVAYKQYVLLHNQSSIDIDLAGWKVQYAKTGFTDDCDAAEWSTEGSLSGTVAAGKSIIVPYQLTDATAGSVRVIDIGAFVHDTAGWGGAPCAETQPLADVPTNDKSIVRYTACDGTYVGADTNNNSMDFVISDQPFAAIKAPECTPTCQPSQQLIDGVCVDDQCENIEGFQAVVPDGYQKEGVRCFLDLLPLTITELLPNAIGSDEGKEFIELYNSHSQPIELKRYMLRIGTKTFILPTGTIAAGEYKVFYDGDLGFTLSNTTANVSVESVDGTVFHETPEYVSAGEGEAWASINGTWQFTNRPTPAAANLPSISNEQGNGSVGEGTLKPCAANQYRSPETNRCRLATAAASELTPCKEGQYRSEETNRCRNSVSTAGTLTSCKEGQYRSEETNRCRSIAADVKELTPCKEGQERNPDTNRCRNVAASQPTQADYAVEPVKETATAFAGWWALGGISALAAGKIGWEWREEIMNAVRKIGSFFTSGK